MGQNHRFREKGEIVPLLIGCLGNVAENTINAKRYIKKDNVLVYVELRR